LALRGGGVQAKLRVSRPGDALEQEADRAADAVMRIPSAGSGYGLANDSTAPEVQRLCSSCGDEEKINRQSSVAGEEEEETLQAKSSDAGNQESSVRAGNIEGLRSGGKPLPASARDFFEPRFGRDFSSVRIHADTTGGEAARSFNAEAFAYKNHLAFAPGRYDPDSGSGRRLLAHELAHVVQQGYAGSESGPGQEDGGQAWVLPYRKKGSYNYGAQDDTGKNLVEKEFDRKKPDPYVKKITVHFTGIKTLSGESVPSGTVSAEYAKNKASPMPSDITGIPIVGGYPSQGLSDSGTGMKLGRVEGWGYNRSVVPASERAGKDWLGKKYFKASLNNAGDMSYAMFYKGPQAVHFGLLTAGSLSRVHVRDFDSILRMNYHARSGVTVVDVKYDAAALEKPCCERMPVKGTMKFNPCSGQDPKKCP
jgi:hypothetical protein